jgi:hypothetical protein
VRRQECRFQGICHYGVFCAEQIDRTAQLE